MFPVVPSSSRLVLTQTVRARVYQTFRQNNSIVGIRLYSFTEFRRVIWQNHLIQVRTYSITRITSWYPNWLTQWRPAQPAQPQAIQQQPAGGGGGGGGQSAPGRLTPQRIAELIGDQNFFVHGTHRSDVGTLTAPLLGIAIQELRVSNQAAPVGVFVFRGVTGAYHTGYGPYFVIIRGGMGSWIEQQGQWYRPGEAGVRPEEIEGWCTREDIKAALELRGARG